MKSTQKIILTIGLIVLICSCENAGPGQKANATEPDYSIANTKILEGPKRTEAEAKALSDEIYKRCLDGEDFGKLAILYSEDPGSAINGGRYDSIRKDIFVPEFEKVVFNLKLNEISAPFLTEYGYHIATVIAIREDERDARHILIRFNE